MKDWGCGRVVVYQASAIDNASGIVARVMDVSALTSCFVKGNDVWVYPGIPYYYRGASSVRGVSACRRCIVLSDLRVV